MFDALFPLERGHTGLKSAHANVCMHCILHVFMLFFLFIFFSAYLVVALNSFAARFIPTLYLPDRGWSHSGIPTPVLSTTLKQESTCCNWSKGQPVIQPAEAVNPLQGWQIIILHT